MNDLSIPTALVRLTYSYTSLNAYENCPHAFFRRYVLKDQKYVETPAMKHGNDGHSAFELRIGGQKPLPVTFARWERFAAPFDGRGAKVEMKVAITQEFKPCDFWDKSAFIRGKLDTVVMHGTKAYLCDWKFGKPREEPFELEVGAMLLKARFSELMTIKAQYAWLKEDRLGETYDVSDTRKTAIKVAGIIKKINTDRVSGEFEKRKSGLCGFCSVEDCENHYVAQQR